MSNYTVVDKNFARIEIGRTDGEIKCYSNPCSQGMSLAEYLGYIIDTSRGVGRCTDGKCTLEGVQLLIKIGQVSDE